MINALLWGGGSAAAVIILAALAQAPQVPRHEICMEPAFEQRDGNAIPRDFTEACQTRATGDAQ